MKTAILCGIAYGAGILIAIAAAQPLATSLQLQAFVDTLGGRGQGQGPSIESRLFTTGWPLPSTSPNMQTLGVTVRVDDRCVVTVIESHRDDRELLAHEACHCVLDYEVLTSRGYARIPRLEIAARERRAQACATWMIAPGREQERLEALRTGEIPRGLRVLELLQ